MLPTNFANIAPKPSDFRSKLEALERWCAAHQELPVIDPRRLANDVPIDPVCLNNLLFFLVENGVLEQVYRFETPAGYFLPDEYKSYRDIPDELLDRYNHDVIARESGRVIPVFRGHR